MNNEYVIYESKLNHLSLEELDKIDPNIKTAVLERILNLSNKPNSGDLRAFNTICDILAHNDNRNLLKSKENLGCLYFDRKNEKWGFQIILKRKKYATKMNKSRLIVEKHKETLLRQLSLID